LGIIFTKDSIIRPHCNRYDLSIDSFHSYNIIVIDNDQDYLTVLNDAQAMLRDEHSITQATIQIEPYDEQIMNSCENCRRPGS
jgi:hypothetical protein